VPLIVTGSRTDGTAFKVVDSIVVAPLTKGRKFVTVTSSVPGTWIDAGSMDSNADAGGFASFVRCYGDQSYVTTFTAPASANQKAFRNWVVDGVDQPLGVRTIQVPLSGDHTVRAKYLARRPRRAPTEIRPAGVGPTQPQQ